MDLIQEPTMSKPVEIDFNHYHGRIEALSSRRFTQHNSTNRVLKKETAEPTAAEEILRSHPLLLAAIREPMALVDVNYIHLAVNDAYLNVFKIKKSNAEIIGHSITEIFGEKIFKMKIKNHLDRSIRGEHVHYKGWLNFPDETTKYMNVSYYPIIGSGGSVTSIIVTARDMTEHKHAEEALRESEEKYRNLFEQSRDPIYINTWEGEFIDVNQAFLTLFGYSRKEMIGKNVMDLYTNPEDRIRFQEKIEHEGSVIDYEVKFCTKAGDEKDCLLTSSVRHSEDGDVIGYQGIIRDITQQKLLQKELARAHRLEAAGRMAGQIAHDFNNLLSPLAGYPALIREHLKPGHPVLKMIDEIEFVATKISEINQQLLALGRRGFYPMENINLNELLHKVVLSQNLPPELTVQEELASDLFLVYGGPGQLTRALLNLIVNAKEALQARGTITLRTNNVYLKRPLPGYKVIQCGYYVKLEVSDSGPGIEPDILNTIFEPFFTTKKMNKVRGSGLGLSVVQSIIEDHKGYITVESTLGKGTTFSLYFPISKEEEIAEATEEIRGGNERILVVDDDPIQRKVAYRLLKRLGYQVRSVSSGQEAVSYVKKHPQELLVIDMLMDGMDGTETYRKILQVHSNQKAIIFSGHAMSKRTKEAQRLGAGAFLTKPVTLNSLGKAVRTELDKKPI